MSAIQHKELLIRCWTDRCRELLQQRNNLSEQDLEYVVSTVEKLKDERLKECVATLIGWGDTDRADLETFCALSLEVMKASPPSRLRGAACKIEIRYRLRMLTGHEGT